MRQKYQSRPAIISRATDIASSIGTRHRFIEPPRSLRKYNSWPLGDQTGSQSRSRSGASVHRHRIRRGANSARNAASASYIETIWTYASPATICTAMDHGTWSAMRSAAILEPAFIAGVTNSASFAISSGGVGAPVAPGSLIAIFGSNFGSIQYDASGVTVVHAQERVLNRNHPRESRPMAARHVGSHPLLSEPILRRNISRRAG